MICCDTCPFYPTCEEIEDFRRDVLGLDDDYEDDYFDDRSMADMIPDDWQGEAMT